jgi:hypothetical protein
LLERFTVELQTGLQARKPISLDILEIGSVGAKTKAVDGRVTENDAIIDALTLCKAWK